MILEFRVEAATSCSKTSCTSAKDNPGILKVSIFGPGLATDKRDLGSSDLAHPPNKLLPESFGLES
jgi:hypothetical protein